MQIETKNPAPGQTATGFGVICLMAGDPFNVESPYTEVYPNNRCDWIAPIVLVPWRAAW